MQNKMRQRTECRADVVCVPALTPLEASVLQAREKETYGALRMIRYAYDAGAWCPDQRAKIWVR